MRLLRFVEQFYVRLCSSERVLYQGGKGLVYLVLVAKVLVRLTALEREGKNVCLKHGLGLLGGKEDRSKEVSRNSKKMVIIQDTDMNNRKLFVGRMGAHAIKSQS